MIKAGVASRVSLLLFGLLAVVTLRCTHDRDELGDEDVVQKPARVHKAPAKVAVKPSPKPVAAPTPPPDDHCKVFDKLPPPPVVVPGHGLVLTKMMKPCVSYDGKAGFDQATPYLAMGFPCTGGSGRIDFKGHYNNPHMVSFILSTDCPMLPPTRDGAQGLLSQAFGLPKTTSLAAYTPFVVQFWEVSGTIDSNVGYAVEFRSAPAVEGLWRRLQAKGSVPVQLYGRENTWVQGGSFYAVEGSLKLTGRTAFELEVSNVKALSTVEVAAVKARCEAIRPARNCEEVF